MQLASIKLRQPYRQQQLTLPRVASFIATANISDVFSDPSGCRRFIAVTLTGPILLPDHIDYEQLYAQAVAELDSGRRYWFDEADTQAIMENNQHYQQRTPAEALFFGLFLYPQGLDQGYLHDCRLYLQPTSSAVWQSTEPDKPFPFRSCPCQYPEPS